jgi:drug/metabolite transporter (DMT)-like permease
MMKRIYWTLGMAIIGVFLALKGQDVNVKVSEIATGGIWAAAIGFGLGSIFDQRRPEKRLIIYWAATLTLVALFFGPIVPVSSFLARETIAGVLGALAGAILGVVQLKLTRHESKTSEMPPSR